MTFSLASAIIVLESEGIEMYTIFYKKDKRIDIWRCSTLKTLLIVINILRRADAQILKIQDSNGEVIEYE